jgi:hypothetical protein
VVVTVNITASTLSIIDLWRKGHEILAAKSHELEQTKIGTLRGGSVGFIDSDGDVQGKCHRLAHLRSLGFQETKDEETHLMFGAGYDNEDQWLANLQAAWTGTIKREHEHPVSWTTSSGQVVNGRPDIVLLDETAKSVLGIELKLVSSVWTAYDVHYKFVPKLDHLIQASHYMWQLNIPYKLIYSSRVNWLVPYNVRHKLEGKHDVVYRERGDKKEIDKITPFIREYDLDIRDGVVYYQTKGMTVPQQTLITVDGIKQYYEYLSTLSQTKDLKGRPLSLDAVGDVMSWSQCGRCPLKETCDTYESNYELWLDNAKLKFTR